MKVPCALALLSLLTLTACHEKQAEQPAPPDDQEVERRVQQRLADEHRAEADRQALAREQQLADREQKLAERERELRAQSQTTPAVGESTEAAPMPAAPVREEVADSYQTFYDALAPYGAWIELDDYGYVWQPRVVLQNGRWRPYTVGHWAYTDYGWTWISNEPWGWATYHYGRWAHLRRLGWVWVPGEQWAPAWVSWRNSDRYIGWAPLPPEARFDGSRGIHEWADENFDIASDDYVFVPGSDFGDDDLAQVSAPPEQNVAIFNDTVNVTNIVEYNTVIVCRGLDLAFVNAHCRRPFAQLKVERRAGTRGGGNLAEVKGGTVQIVAPVIKKASVAARPAQVTAHTSDSKIHAPRPAATAGATPFRQPMAAAPNTPVPRSTPMAAPVEIAPRAATPPTQPPVNPQAAMAQRRAAIEAQRAERARQIQTQQAPAPVVPANEIPREPARHAPVQQNQLPAPMPVERNVPEHVPQNPAHEQKLAPAQVNQPAHNAQEANAPARQRHGVEPSPSPAH